MLGNHYIDHIQMPVEGGTLDVSTVRAFDTGRYETCLFADHRTTLEQNVSEVVATYPGLNEAAAGHRAIVRAVTFALQADHPFPEE